MIKLGVTLSSSKLLLYHSHLLLTMQSKPKPLPVFQVTRLTTKLPLRTINIKENSLNSSTSNNQGTRSLALPRGSKIRMLLCYRCKRSRRWTKRSIWIWFKTKSKRKRKRRKEKRKRELEKRGKNLRKTRITIHLARLGQELQLEIKMET